MENTQTPSLSEQTSLLKKATQYRIPLYILVGILGLFSIGLILIAIYTNRFILLILATAFSLTTIVGILSISKVWNATESLKYLAFSLLLEITISLTSGILPVYSGFPYALLAISLAFSISSLLPTAKNSDWIIWTGLLGVIGSILLSILAPFEQIIDANFQFIVFGFLGLVLIGLVYLFITKSINVNLRVKLILGALALSLLPITALALINNQYLRSSIQQQANNSLLVAANQTIS